MFLAILLLNEVDVGSWSAGASDEGTGDGGLHSTDSLSDMMHFPYPCLLLLLKVQDKASAGKQVSGKGRQICKS